MFILKKGNDVVQLHHAVQISAFTRHGYVLVEDEMTKEALWEQLAERGTKFDKRMSVESLQELLTAK